MVNGQWNIIREQSLLSASSPRNVIMQMRSKKIFPPLNMISQIFPTWFLKFIIVHQHQLSCDQTLFHCFMHTLNFKESRPILAGPRAGFWKKGAECIINERGGKMMENLLTFHEMSDPFIIIFQISHIWLFHKPPQQC